VIAIFNVESGRGIGLAVSSAIGFGADVCRTLAGRHKWATPRA
jgi:hypothetical protein